jgi:hypothetical protein
MAAEQVLHIVLRRCQQDVDARLLHQPIETVDVERDGVGASR